MKNKTILVTATSILLILLTTRLFWFALLFALSAGFYFLISNLKFLQKRNWKIKGIKSLMTFVFILCVAISVRVFFFEVFAIPSGSMEDTLVPGDKIVVNKMIYGPQMPRSPFEIPWINLFFYMTKDTTTKIDSVWWDPRRLTGISKIERNDVLVFKNEPVCPGYFIKRCVALPGDVLQIINSDLYINGTYAGSNNLPHVKKRQLVYSHNLSGLNQLLDSLQICQQRLYYPETDRARELFLTTDEANKLRNEKIIDSVKVNIQAVDSAAWFYPYYRRKTWSVDNYGPLKVPVKGWTINLSDSTAILYLGIIAKWESNPISWHNGHYYIDDDEITQYTFQNDYYFIMGDNRHNSIDSRMWGFLPEYKIVGKATNVLWSNNDVGFKWNRIFKKIK
jgi:signal peptidase I